MTSTSDELTINPFDRTLITSASRWHESTITRPGTELTIPGPRGGKGKARKTLDVFGSGYAWNKCDVRVVTPDVLRASEAIDRAIDALRKRKDALFAERFYDLDPLTWEAIQEAGKPWRRIWEALEAYKKREATSQYVQDVIREVLG